MCKTTNKNLSLLENPPFIVYIHVLTSGDIRVFAAGKARNRCGDQAKDTTDGDGV